MSQVLVFGASGTVGSELVKNLKKKGHTVLAATSKKDVKDGQVYLDITSGDGLKEAFKNIEKAFFLSPAGYVDQLSIFKPLIQAAKEFKLKKVVLMTAMGVDANEQSPMRQAELLLINSGLNYNIIRPNWFMQNFNSFWLHGIINENKISLPLGTAKGSFIDARDIAAVAAELLNDEKFNNQIFDLTGQDVINHNDVAKIISTITNKKVEYSDIPPSQMKGNLLSAGLGEDYTNFLLMILEFFKLGYSERTTDSVKKITGKDPITFQKYAEDYKQAWL